ncbi:HAD family hydrolase [Sediminibacillus massiliensis]|uniref:HAD family hydrolase n=1 Tax=Sediminibacillus massiliensis TaxID=1926277 RepID=UPI0015C322D3|nr:HAD family hydrolase [Sediminibacillus massiliensis]
MSFDAKAIILDMDGTMLDQYNEISETLVTVISQLRASGKLVFIATGRTKKEINDVAPSKLKVDGVVCSNGMAVYTETGYLIKNRLDKSLVDKLVEKARSNQVYYEVHSLERPAAALREDKRYFEELITDPKPETVKEDEWRSRVAAIDNIEWGDHLPTDDAVKIYFFNREKQGNTEWKQTLDQIKKQKDFSTFSSSDHNVEVMGESISKATGVQYILEKFDLENEEIMMVGDSENDLPLMEIAGYAVAMKNAPDHVKETVDEVTEFSHTEDGLAQFLKNTFNVDKEKLQG